VTPTEQVASSNSNGATTWISASSMPTSQAVPTASQSGADVWGRQAEAVL